MANRTTDFQSVETTKHLDDGLEVRHTTSDGASVSEIIAENDIYSPGH